MAKELITEAVLEGDPISADDLLAIPGFNTIPKEKHEKFPGAIVKRRITPGSNITRQGEHGTTAFYILSGTAQVFVSGPSARSATPHSRQPKGGWLGNLRNLAGYLKGVPADAEREASPETGELELGRPVSRVGPGDIFGELEALNALKEQKRPRPKFYPRAATVRATSDMVVLEMLPNYLNVVLYPALAFREKLTRTYRARAIEYTIRSAPVFQGLSEELLMYLCSRADLVDFEPDQVICQRGDEARFLDVIRLGFVKLAQSFPGGELVLAYLSRNSYFGEMGLLPVLRVRARSDQPETAVECLVSKTPVKVGRAASSPDDLLVPWDDYISRENHAELSVEANRLKVVRRSGKNPIRFNDSLVDTALVAPGQSFVLGQTTFDVEVDATAGRHTATATATDFVQLVRIKAADFPRVMENSAETAAAIADVARGRRQIEAQVLGRVQQVSLTDFLNQDLMQGQDVLLLDLDRCTRCDECSKACVATHADGVSRLVRDGLRFQEYLVTTSCRACLDPLCMTHCPVGAIRRKGSSLDIVIEDWCIGCCNCAQDCPYGAINVVELPGGPANGEKPGLKPKATVCDLCRDYPEPNCVRACPHDAAMRVQPSFFFARDLAGVQLTVKPKPPARVLAEIGNETKILSSVDLVNLVPRLVLEESPGGTDPLPPGHQRSFPLRVPGSTSFGRDSVNNWVLQNHSVSKKHASIECQGNRYVLHNLSEVNITVVNDQPVSDCELHAGDLIEMGEVKLRFLGGAFQ